MPFDGQTTDFTHTEVTTPVFPDAAEWRRVLWKAADYIEEHGWWQGDYSHAGHVCMIGAVGFVTGENVCNLHSKVYEPNHFLHMLSQYVGTHDVSIWNDAPERTAEEVIATLRKCALEG